MKMKVFSDNSDYQQLVSVASELSWVGFDEDIQDRHDIMTGI